MRAFGACRRGIVGLPRPIYTERGVFLLKHIKPNYMPDFFCRGSLCPGPCAAPVDMTWTWALGDTCEAGVCMGCPLGAELILLRTEKTQFPEEKDDSPAAALRGLEPDQLALMLDARRTMDIILQNRELPFRTDVVLALTYGAEFDPMIGTDARYAYEELDWGFTEQPYRQVQAVVQLQGGWENKLSDLKNMLLELRVLCRGDTVLAMHLAETFRLFETMSGEEYRTLRERFDGELKQREHLFEQLLVYLVHRHFFAHAEEQTVRPCLQLLAVSFAALRAMAVRLWLETGSLTDGVFTDLCWHYARCVEDTPEIREKLLAAFEASPLYSRERLQRLLWN